MNCREIIARSTGTLFRYPFLAPSSFRPTLVHNIPSHPFRPQPQLYPSNTKKRPLRACLLSLSHLSFPHRSRRTTNAHPNRRSSFSPLSTRGQSSYRFNLQQTEHRSHPHSTPCSPTRPPHPLHCPSRPIAADSAPTGRRQRIGLSSDSRALRARALAQPQFCCFLECIILY